jgi:hypothetical protein
VAFSDSNRTLIRVIEESVWGTTPASGTSREVRLTSSSLGAAKETVVSDELRSDRMVSAVTEVAASSNGDINFELSAGAQDEFLAAFLMGAWSRPQTCDFYKGNVAVTTTTAVTIYGVDATAIYPIGRRFLLKGFSTGANNGYFSVSAVNFTGGNTVITTVETGLVVEAISTAAGIYDANDVIILNATTLSSTATGFAITASGFSSAIAAGQLLVGQKIVVEGLAGVTGVYTITALSNTTITTSPAPSATVAAGTKASIKGAILRNPASATAIAQRKFSIETAYTDVGQYMLQTGMVPGKFTLELATGAIVTGSYGFEGRSTAMNAATVIGTAPYTPLAAQAGQVVNATTNVGAITKNGVALAAALQNLSISGEANLRQQAAIGSKFARGIGAGRFALTGSVTAYFEDAVMFNHFLNHDTVSLSFAITDANGYSYVYTLPAVKFTSDQVAPGGIDQDIVNNVEYTAFRDAATGCMLQVDRFSPNL